MRGPARPRTRAPRTAAHGRAARQGPGLPAWVSTEGGDERGRRGIAACRYGREKGPEDYSGPLLLKTLRRVKAGPLRASLAGRPRISGRPAGKATPRVP